jgi:hypothetical protein
MAIDRATIDRATIDDTTIWLLPARFGLSRLYGRRRTELNPWRILGGVLDPTPSDPALRGAEPTRPALPNGPPLCLDFFLGFLLVLRRGRLIYFN